MIAFSYGNSPGAAGLITTIKRSWLDDSYTIDVKDMIPGRLFTVTVSMPRGKVDFTNLHLVPNWDTPYKREVIDRALEAVTNPKHISFLSGDFNFPAPGEFNYTADGSPSPNNGILQGHFTNAARNNVEINQPDFTHYGANNFSRIDRHYTNLSSLAWHYLSGNYV